MPRSFVDEADLRFMIHVFAQQAEDSLISSSFCNLLLAVCERNADAADMLAGMVSLLELLTTVLQAHCDDHQLLASVARILNMVVLSAACDIEALARTGVIRLLLLTLSRHVGHSSVVAPLCLALGTVWTKFSHLRAEICQASDLIILSDVLKNHMDDVVAIYNVLVLIGYFMDIDGGCEALVSAQALPAIKSVMICHFQRAC